ncbi:hypothetical protein M422DRAFT_177361 [Sphaerobolus stellatus SS14]|uniref:DDE-1 domain-containing protein n=1 Tax=Sphaerobolus stellatus (strain SS14) TaxID=990650 RepID=A0A0C9VJT6_SPHS4|nr:hypothetical protein M422DRAFT_177361 [Sphaerobolus stellatus SS14]
MLNKEQADALIQFCHLQANQARPLTRLILKQKVFELVGRTPGDQWVRRFLRARPDVLTGKAYGLDPKRAESFRREVVYDYFDKLEDIVVKHNIQPHNIYNFDEKGVQLGGGRKNINVQYIFPRDSSNRYVLKSDSLLLITIIEAASATGDAVPPGFILPPGDLEDFTHVPGVGCVTVTHNGWTDNSVCHQWFSKVFIPFINQRRQANEYVVLIMDGHKSHETDQMLLLALANKIILICLPGHTTHKLQPMDVRVFGPFQTAWGKHCTEMACKGQPVTRDTMIEEYVKASLLLNFFLDAHPYLN